MGAIRFSLKSCFFVFAWAALFAYTSRVAYDNYRLSCNEKTVRIVASYLKAHEDPELRKLGATLVVSLD